MGSPRDPVWAAAAAALPDLVQRLRRLVEPDWVVDATAALLLKIAPATIDRRLKADRANNPTGSERRARLQPQSRSIGP